MPYLHMLILVAGSFRVGTIGAHYPTTLSQREWIETKWRLSENRYNDESRIGHKSTHILHKHKRECISQAPFVWSHDEDHFFHGWMTATTMITTIISSRIMA
jgi:hypothetical protein